MPRTLATEEEMGATSVRPKDAPAPVALNPDLEPGTVVGEYRVTGKLGQGAMGQVFAGVQPVIGKKVAIKVLNRELAASEEMVQRFIQEARAVNRIAHANIIDVFSFGQLPDGRHYYIMELLEGESLGSLLSRERLGQSEAVRLLGQICGALAAAHSEGVVHRDLKPDNIYVARPKHGEPYIKILDFGIAKLLKVENAASATRTGVPVGTPYYMSPEQVKGLKTVDHRSDIYALGVIMFEIFTGKVPFVRDTVLEIFVDHVSTPPPRPSTLGAVSQDLESLILRCLEKDPERRPQSADEVGKELQRIPAQAPPAVGKPEAGKSAFAATSVSSAVRRVAEKAPSLAPPPSDAKTKPPQQAVAAPAASAQAASLKPRRSKLIPLAIGLVVLGGGVIAVLTVSGGSKPASDLASIPTPGEPIPPTHKRGVLRISADVPVARFQIDGKEVAQGKTATLNDIEGGVKHKLHAEAEGQLPQDLEVQVAEGGESDVEVKFKPEPTASPLATPPPPPVLAPAPPLAAATPAKDSRPRVNRPKADVPQVDSSKPAAPKHPEKKQGRDDTADPFPQ